MNVITFICKYIYKYKFPYPPPSLCLPPSLLTGYLGTTRHFPLHFPRPQNGTVLKKQPGPHIQAFLLLAVWILDFGCLLDAGFQVSLWFWWLSCWLPHPFRELGPQEAAWVSFAFIPLGTAEASVRPLSCLGTRGPVKTIIPVPDRGLASAVLWIPSPSKGDSHSFQQSSCLHGSLQPAWL